MRSEIENNMENLANEYEGKAVCHTYPSLVSELASRMVVNEKVLLTNKKDKFDPEDIFSWIKAVDYKDTQNAPDVQAILSTKQGAETITFDVRKEEKLKDKNEKVSKESLLYAMALTDAKMKLISTEAEEVYPAVAYQIKDYRKEMEKVREEILENKEDKRSLEDVLGSLTGNRVIPLATAGIITMIVLSSCGANPEVTKTAIPGEDTSQPTATESSPAGTEIATETPFVEVTATEAPTATEVVKIEEHDLNPRYTMEIEQSYLGVDIKASLITDESLPPIAEKITISKEAYANYITRVMFWAWWSNSTDGEHTGMWSEEDYKSFMSLWATAQETNSPADWGKVEFTAWANDLNDGDGYVQDKMTFWPMHTGETPDGVRNIEKMSVVILDMNLGSNMSIVTDRTGSYSQGYGTNIDNNELYLYDGFPLEYGNMALWPSAVAQGMTPLVYWFSRVGNSSNLPPINMSITNMLINGGISTGVKEGS